MTFWTRIWADYTDFHGFLFLIDMLHNLCDCFLYCDDGIEDLTGFENLLGLLTMYVDKLGQ